MTFRKLLRYALPLALIGIMASSCNKDHHCLGQPNNGNGHYRSGLPGGLWDMGQKLPAVGIYNHTMNEILVFRSVNDGSRSFAFSTMPASGINFASSNGGQWVWTEEGGIGAS